MLGQQGLAAEAMRIRYPQTIRPTPKQLEEHEEATARHCFGFPGSLVAAVANRAGSQFARSGLSARLQYSARDALVGLLATVRLVGLAAVSHSARSSGAEDGRGAWRG